MKTLWVLGLSFLALSSTYAEDTDYEITESPVVLDGKRYTQIEFNEQIFFTQPLKADGSEPDHFDCLPLSANTFSPLHTGQSRVSNRSRQFMLKLKRDCDKMKRNLHKDSDHASSPEPSSKEKIRNNSEHKAAGINSER